MNVLLIRLRLIGDVVFTTPLIRALREQFPDARLSYLVEQSAAPVVSSNPHLTSVITTTHTRGWRRFTDDLALARQLRAARFDVVLDLHGGPRSAWLTWASRAPVRVGYDVPGRSWMYTRVIPRPKTYRPRHAVENQWDLVASLDPAIPRSPDRTAFPVEMWPSRNDETHMTQQLAAWAIPASAPVVVLHVSAGNPFRRWPESHFSAVIARLASADAARYVLVTAGPSDRDATGRIVAAARQLAPEVSPRIITADTLSLGALRALLDRAALFIGGDSGPMHVAATSRVPIVSIYGPTLPERSSPWRPEDVPLVSLEPGMLPCRPCDQRECAPGDFRCLAGVDAARVVAAAEQLLGVAR